MLLSFSSKEEYLKQVSYQFDTQAVGLFLNPLKALLIKEMEQIFISFEKSKKKMSAPLIVPQWLEATPEEASASLLDNFSYTLEFGMEFTEKISQPKAVPTSPTSKIKSFHSTIVPQSVDCKCSLLIKTNDVSQVFDFKTGTLLFADHQYLPHANQFVFFEFSSVAHSQHLQQFPDNNTFATIVKSLQDVTTKSGANSGQQLQQVKRQQKKKNQKLENTPPLGSTAPLFAPLKVYKWWLGAEYKLENGKKFILNFSQLQSLKQRREVSQQTTTSTSTFIDCELPFLLNYQNLIGNMSNFGADTSYQRGRKKTMEEMARLIKIIVITPDADDCLLFNPTLQLETNEGVHLFKPAQFAECATVLPRNTYVSIAFEFANMNDILWMENLILASDFVSMQTATK